ncbi:MAG: BTAD domain-containing putative transcriptional regulator [Burkholderiales bacterium]
MERLPPRLAKFTPPDVTELVPRERLFTKLTRADKHTVVWVTGPAGSGKTALVASWLAATKARYVWYSLDEGDADPATFFYYLGLAARPDGDEPADGLPALRPEYLPSLDLFARQYFQILFDRLEAPWVLVLDNYEIVGSTPQSLTILESALRGMIRGVTLILVSREDPPARLARWQATSEMAVLGWSDLKLTDDESAGFVRRWGFEPEALKPLVEASGGWAAGLMLMLNAHSDGTPLPTSRFVPGPLLVDYFAEESFAKAPANQRDFLLKTAFLPRMTVAMGEKAAGQSDAGAILAELNRQNLFTDRRGGHEGIYEYHPLFRDFLLARAESAFAPEEFQRRRRDAAALLEADGQIEAAADLYIRGREWSELTDLIRQHAWVLVAQARHQTLHAWLGAMPEAVISASPWLSFRKGSCELLRDPEQGRGWLERAFARFQEEKEPVGLYLTWSAIMESFALQRGSFVEVDRWIGELEQLRKQYPEYPTTDIEVRVMNGGVALMIRQLQHPILKQWSKRVLELMPVLPDPHQRAQLASFAMMYSLWRGDLRSARVVRAELEAVAASRKVAPLSAQLCLMWEITQDVCDANIEAALENTRKVLALAEASGVHVLDVWHHYHAAYACIVAGDLEGAEGHASSMQSVLVPGQLMNKVNFHYLRASIHLCRGDAKRALELAEEFLKPGDDLGSAMGSAIFRIQLAMILIAAGDHSRAREILARTLGLADVLGSDLVRFSGLCALAHSLLSTGEEELGLSALRRAFSLGATQDLMTCYPVSVPGMMENLCSRALDIGIETDYVQRLIGKRRLTPISTAIPAWPWPLRIYTLGKFAIECDGKPLRSSGKAQHKPLDLLKALIAFGGRDVNTRILTEALWPDADGDAAQGAFDATLHRLRRLLGVDNAVQLKDGKLSLNENLCWVDAWTFEQACRQEEAADADRGIESIAREARLIRRLYRGPFMASEDDQPWMLQSRERLRGLFRRRVTALGQVLESRYQWDQAIELFQQALDIDPIAEEMYQHLMLAQRELGRLADALDIYRRCRETLSLSLGIRPSPTTEAIHRSLREVS